jgi:hypothetical protein
MLINTYINKRFGMGFGDFIRGTLSCHQLCSAQKIPFAVDFRHHDMGKYLDIAYQYQMCESGKILDLMDIRRFTVQCLKYSLASTYKDLRYFRKNNAYIYTNVWPRVPLRHPEKEYIKSILIPTAELKEAIEVALPIFEQYEVIHIRSGDLFAFNTQIGETFKRSKHELVEKLSVIQKIKECTDKKIIVMSDSMELKTILANKFNILVPNTVPSHCAIETSNVKDTLIDFFIMMKASHIHQFSVHHWGSGFSNSINWVYDVPLTTYKI